MVPITKKVVICGGVRTPIGHLGKGLSGILPEELMEVAIRGLLKKFHLNPEAVDGVLIGWVGQGSHAPNIARVSALKAGIPLHVPAITYQANCVSSLESVASAARHIAMGEGELFLAGGTESMSIFPYAIRGSRAHKKLRSLETTKANWNELWQDPEINITDTTEEGLTDPIEHINMAATAEICAQMYGVSRAEEDKYAFESYRKGLAAEKAGFYDTHVVPFVHQGQKLLEKDEYPYLREGLVEKPKMLEKAPALFDGPSYSIKDFYRDNGKYIEGKTYEEGKTQGTVTLFNACARSDGAGLVIVCSEEKARALDLPILAELKGYGFYGTNPAYMGVAPVYATKLALDRAGIAFADLTNIELHEAFAATCLAIFRLGGSKFDQNWQSANDRGLINPHGGTLALGHPLAMTGVRLLLNLLYAMQADAKAKFGMAAACASGGLGGAMVVEKAA